MEQDVTPDRKMLMETDTNEGEMSGFFLLVVTLWDQVRSRCFLKLCKCLLHLHLNSPTFSSRISPISHKHWLKINYAFLKENIF